MKVPEPYPNIFCNILAGVGLSGASGGGSRFPNHCGYKNTTALALASVGMWLLFQEVFFIFFALRVTTSVCSQLLFAKLSIPWWTSHMCLVSSLQTNYQPVSLDASKLASAPLTCGVQLLRATCEKQELASIPKLNHWRTCFQRIWRWRLLWMLAQNQRDRRS